MCVHAEQSLRRCGTSTKLVVMVLPVTHFTACDTHRSNRSQTPRNAVRHDMMGAHLFKAQQCCKQGASSHSLPIAQYCFLACCCSAVLLSCVQGVFGTFGRGERVGGGKGGQLGWVLTSKTVCLRVQDTMAIEDTANALCVQLGYTALCTREGRISFWWTLQDFLVCQIHDNEAAYYACD